MMSKKILICNARFRRLRYVQGEESQKLFCVIYKPPCKTRSIDLKYLAYIAVVTFTLTQGPILCMSFVGKEGNEKAGVILVPGEMIFHRAAKI